MSDHFKTVETNTEPCIIITNDLGEYGGRGSVILGHYWFKGDDNEVAPKLTMDTENVIYLTKEDVEKLIVALQEFI